QVLAEADPIRMKQAAAREADKIDEQGQSLSVMTSRGVHIDGAYRRVTQHVTLEAWLSIVTRLTEPIDPKNLRMLPTPFFCHCYQRTSLPGSIRPFDCPV